MPSFPIFEFIEIETTNTCNRKCTFCPKVDPKVAPDTFQKMSREIIDKIHQLKTESLDLTKKSDAARP